MFVVSADVEAIMGELKVNVSKNREVKSPE
jgi:hypothetical protein